MALNTSKCNHLTPLHFKGLTVSNDKLPDSGTKAWKQTGWPRLHRLKSLNHYNCRTPHS